MNSAETVDMVAMTELSSRPYRGADDLRLMQDEVIRSAGTTTWHIGDYAWQSRSSTHYDLAIQISLWFDGDELVGWTWVKPQGGMHLYIVPERRGVSAVWDTLLDAIDDQAQARRAAGDALESLHVWCVEETDLARPFFVARGFTESDSDGGDILLADLSGARALPLPDGYRFDAMTDDADLHGRVEVHRAAFAPSAFTLIEYRRARRTWPYRAELDRVVRGPSGQIVAAALAWLDAENRYGLLEPVAVDPGHHNRGLGRAVVADALLALREAGATRAQIGTSGAPAKAAYMAAGFTPWKVETTFEKRLTGMSESARSTGAD